MNVGIIEMSGSSALESYTALLSNELIRDSNVSSICLFVPQHFDVPDLICERVDVERIPVPQSNIRSMVSGFTTRVSQVVERIKLTEVDIIHLINEIGVPYTYLKALSCEYPIISTVHEPEAYVPTLIRSLLLNRIQNLNTKLICDYSDRIIVHGSSSKYNLTSRGVDSENIDICPHGSFAPYFYQYDYEDTEHNETEILFFGRIFPGKGIQYLINASYKIHQAMPDSKVVIAGRGDLSSIVKGNDISHIDIRNRYIPDAEVAKLFQRASVVVLPYTNGSQSGVIGIAAGFKTPVIATDVGNFSQMVLHTKTGLIIPPKDSVELADAVIDLMKNDAKRQHMGREAYRLYNNEYSWSSIARKTITAYHSAISS